MCAYAYTDYCNASLCGRNIVHVACNASKHFAPGCMSASEIKLDEQLQKVIVDLHNSRRSQVATGKLSGFPTASNMLEMVLPQMHFNNETLAFDLYST